MLTWSYQSVSGLIYYLLGSTEIVRVLDQLQSRVLYWDTDSVIFTSKEGDWDPPVGDFLCELTNELDKGDWITEFVCNGQKITLIRHTRANGCVKSRDFP